MPHSLRGLVALATMVSLPALAVTNVYTTSATFLAAVQAGSYTEPFTTPTGVFNSPVSLSSGGFSYQMSTPTVAFGVYRSGTVVGNTYSAELFRITFTSGNITAVGANFYQTNAGDTFTAAPVTLTLSDGTTTTFTPTSATVGSFAGFTSSAPITSLVISAPAADLFNVLDNLTVGVAAVPEVGTFVLMAFGLAGLAARRRIGA